MQTINKSETEDSCRELEKAKYEQIWGVAIYSKNSPAYHRFFDDVKAAINPGDKVIEFGCGTGVGLAELAKTHEVLGIDIAANCLTVDVPFKQACLWDELNVTGDVGFCVDVMEHIPTHKVDAVFAEIMKCVPRCLFIPCLLPDSLGEKHVKKPLHLTVKPAQWWRETAAKFGTVKGFKSDARRATFVLERR